MKYLKTYEEVNNEYIYAVGDRVLVNYNNSKVTAKITKKYGNNSYMAVIENDKNETPVEIPVSSAAEFYKDSDGKTTQTYYIIQLIKSIGEPSMNNDIIDTSVSSPSNDIVINSGTGLRT